MTCMHCGQTVETTAQFCNHCGARVAGYPGAPASQNLYRPREGRMIAGVCAGLAVRYGWEVAIVRLVTVLAIVFTGVPLIAYVIAWVVMPNGQYMLPAQASAVPPPPGPGPGSMGV
jgi:phage shock protein C